MDPLVFDGQVAIVTGGASGLGRAIALGAAARGAQVVIADIDAAGAENAAQACGGHALAVDLIKEPERAVEDGAKLIGGLDVLVNNAGVAGPTAKVEDIDPKDWDRTIAVDVNGMFYCTRKGMPMIKAAGGGSIINLSSAAGRLAFPMRTPYSFAKFGVVGFTESLAAEAGPDKVRVNCIQPGVVEGERIDRVISAKAKGLGISFEETKKKMLEGVSMHTTVTAQDIANTALFLATDGGKHISGQAISVCGGARYLV